MTERLCGILNKTKNLIEPVSRSEFESFLGLELELSFVRLRRIRDYKSMRNVFKQPEFVAVMSWNHFKTIRELLSINFKEEISVETKRVDPLWSISLLNLR